MMPNDQAQRRGRNAKESRWRLIRVRCSALLGERHTPCLELGGNFHIGGERGWNWNIVTSLLQPFYMKRNGLPHVLLRLLRGGTRRDATRKVRRVCGVTGFGLFDHN